MQSLKIDCLLGNIADPCTSSIEYYFSLLKRQYNKIAKKDFETTLDAIHKSV